MSELAEPEPRLRVRDVADKLHVSPSTVYRLIDSGQLVAIHVGAGTSRRSGIQVSEASVADFMIRRSIVV
ncbi:helix-turn-helix domain-containing protein [Kitasatospora sp. NPDC085879]|uniref:helix-turn-helix domain-containing protein n=1 Tax=unclassified Kitasatospora TaxID=2633591 RepID=UPI003440E33C